MVSRNRLGRYDLEARDADATPDARSPWSEDQATTSYVSAHLRGFSGAAHGVPPLPADFARPAAKHAAYAAASFDEEPTQWQHTSWDRLPPRASGVARRASGSDRTQPAAAEYFGFEALHVLEAEDMPDRTAAMQRR